MTRGSVAAPGQHEEIKDKSLVSIVTKQSVSRAYGYRFMFLDPRISFPSLDNCNTMGYSNVRETRRMSVHQSSM